MEREGERVSESGGAEEEEEDCIITVLQMEIIYRFNPQLYKSFLLAVVKLQLGAVGNMPQTNLSELLDIFT